MTDETSPDAAPGAPEPTTPEQVAPLHVPMLRIIEVGLAAWVVALAIIVVVPALHTGERSWWPWTCVAGLVLGGIGWAYVRRGRGNARDAA
ncbi:hypothetical protein GCM10009868_10990 [Terrabacter aerolatus]|uniref:DUF2530 domain-containing protein n=1 Tax=Terrabacter aerolatus TaxID=422442 RepID=A0A512D3Z3_9MICO|nr:DUF2530 domain-containing protein [Terrabacter aerolatus]GEO31184.1 hypothetical protein TAE01_29940 [Terrabacter aerolatus]